MAEESSTTTFGEGNMPNCFPFCAPEDKQSRIKKRAEFIETRVFDIRELELVAKAKREAAEAIQATIDR